MTTTQQIAEYIVHTGFADIDPIVIQRTKDLALSSLGSAVLGAQMDVTRILADYARSDGGAQEAGVIGAGYRTTAEWAAAINCTSAHCTELEDVAWPEAMYTCFLFPTVFSFGETLKASGQAVLEALVIGYEVAARQGTVMTEGEYRGAERGWLTCAHLGAIGAAASASKLLKLDVERTRNAISLAASMAAGLIRQTGSGAHVIEAGLSGKNGIMAAKLASRGLTGNPTILEGPRGYWDAMGGSPEADFELGHGKDFRVMAVGMKKFPCCYLSQRIIDGLQLMRRQHGITPDQVESIEVNVNATFPIVFKYPKPANSEEARFSLPHIVAAAISGERMLFETFSDEKVRDARLIELGRRVQMIVHEDWPRGQLDGTNPVTIRMKDGTSHFIDCIRAHGDSSDPLTPAEVIQKFRDSTTGRLSEGSIEKVAAMVSSLESVDDVSPILNLLAFDGN